MLRVHKKHFHLSNLILQKLCEIGILQMREMRLKMTCIRKYREKAKASISKSLNSLAHSTTAREHVACAFDINSRMPLIVTNHAKHTNLGLWSYYDYENLNFHIS